MDGIPGIIFGPYAINRNRFIIYLRGEERRARRADIKILISLLSLSGEKHRAVYGYEIEELKRWNQDAAKQSKNLRQAVSRLWHDLGDESKDYIVAASKYDPSKKGAYMFNGNARSVADLRSEYSYPLRMSLPPIVKSAPSTTLLSDKERRAVRDIAESLNLEEVALVRKVSERMTYQKYCELLDFKRRQSAIRQKRIHSQLLSYYYDKDLAKHNLHRYSARVNGKTISSNIAVSPDWLNLHIDLEEEQDRFKMVYPFPGTSSLKLEEVADLVASSFLLGVRIRNEPVFCLQDINPAQSKTPVSFSIGQYFEHRLGHGKLGAELVRALTKSELDPEKAISDQRLGLRRDLLPDAGSIKNFSGRRCVGGVNVVVAFQRHDDFVFFVEQRSDEVASARGELCTIPNGFHQALTKRKAEQQVSIRESVFRELWEELFNGEQVIQYDGHNEPDWYYEYPQLHWFTEKKNRKNFEHLWVGFGADLTDGSYQFSVLLVVRSPQYLERYKRSIWPNYEFRHKGELPLEISTKRPDDLAALLTDDLCADTSIFTIVEALRALKGLDKSGRVVLPDIELVTAA